MDAAAATTQSAQHSPSRRDGPWWIISITALVIAVRLIGATQPLVGTFATKHCVYAMIARNWAEGRAPFWQPTLDCLAPSSDERAWHLMEWPASAFVAACGYKWFGGHLDLWGRGVSIFCMAAATLLSYLLARRWFGESAARATSLVVGFAPIGIIYGRGFMLEPSLVALSFLTIYAFDRWQSLGKFVWLAIAAVALALAALTKIYMLLLIVPLAVSRAPAGASRRHYLIAAFTFAVALLPVAAWYYWVHTVSPSVGPAAEYHPESRSAIHGLPHPLLVEPSYYLGVLKNLATVALTPLGLALGLYSLRDRRSRAMLPWLAASLVLLFLLPLKFHVADYYYLILLPPAAMLIGLGWQVAVERFAPSKKWPAALVAASLLIAARYTIGPTWRLHQEDRDVVAAAAELQNLTTTDEPVVTIHGSTLDLLYYCDRRGWALNAADDFIVDKLVAARNQGAKRIVVVHPPSNEDQSYLSKCLRMLKTEKHGDDWRIYRFPAPRAFGEGCGNTSYRWYQFSKQKPPLTASVLPAWDPDYRWLHTKAVPNVGASTH